MKHQIQPTTNHHLNVPNGSIGEQGLLLMNNQKEWNELKGSLRAAGISTNHAAKIVIIEYLQRKQEMLVDFNANEREDKKQPEENEESKESYEVDYCEETENIPKESNRSILITSIRAGCAKFRHSIEEHLKENEILEDNEEQKQSEEAGEPGDNKQSEDIERFQEPGNVSRGLHRSNLMTSIRFGYAKFRQSNEDLRITTDFEEVQEHKEIEDPQNTPKGSNRSLLMTKISKLSKRNLSF